MAEKDSKMESVESNFENMEVQTFTVELLDGKLCQVTVDFKGSTSEANATTKPIEGNADISIMIKKRDEQEFEKVIHYLCDRCGRQFGYEGLLREHIKNYDVICYEKQCYACDQCRDKDSNAENLRRFQELLEVKKQQLCDRCGKQFVFPAYLEWHIKYCDGTVKY